MNLHINSNDDNYTKLKKIFEVSYQNSLHYLTFIHNYLSDYLPYPYNYLVFSIFGYILAYIFGVSSGDGDKSYSNYFLINYFSFFYLIRYHNLQEN